MALAHKAHGSTLFMACNHPLCLVFPRYGNFSVTVEDCQSSECSGVRKLLRIAQLTPTHYSAASQGCPSGANILIKLLSWPVLRALLTNFRIKQVFIHCTLLLAKFHRFPATERVFEAIR